MSDPATTVPSVLTADGRATIDRRDPRVRADYAIGRFVQLDRFVRADELTGIVARLLPVVRSLITRIVVPPLIEPGSLQGGRRFGRVDAGPFEASHYTGKETAAIRRAFRTSGLDAFVNGLWAEVAQFVEFVTARSLIYDRAFLLHYGEGDFVAPHGDLQTSRRVLLQLPVTFECRTAYRVLRGEWMEVFYDDPGALRIVGPGMWHEVVPVLAADPRVAPERIVVTVRLPYAAKSE